MEERDPSISLPPILSLSLSLSRPPCPISLSDPLLLRQVAEFVLQVNLRAPVPHPEAGRGVVDLAPLLAVLPHELDQEFGLLRRPPHPDPASERQQGPRPFLLLGGGPPRLADR